MDHMWAFNEIIHKSVETSIVKADDQESIDCANRVIWLGFFNVGVVCADKDKRLNNLDVVEVANKTILAVSNSTFKINHTKDAVNELDKVNKTANLEELDASFLVLFLDLSEFLHKFSFFLHETCLLFATVLLHVFTNSFDIGITHWFIRK